MNIHAWAKAKWDMVPASYKEHAKSAANTFVAAFLTQACIDLAANGYVIPLEKVAIVSILASAVRAAWKAVVALAVGWWTKRKAQA